MQSHHNFSDLQKYPLKLFVYDHGLFLNIENICENVMKWRG